MNSFNFIPKPIFNILLLLLGCSFVLIPIYFFFGYEPLIVPSINFSMLAHAVWILVFIITVCTIAWSKYTGKKVDLYFHWLSADLLLLIIYAAVSVQLIDYAILFLATEHSEHIVRVQTIKSHSVHVGRTSQNYFTDIYLVDGKTSQHYVFSLLDNPIFQVGTMQLPKQLKSSIHQMGVLKGYHSRLGDVFLQLDLPEVSISLPVPWMPWKAVDLVYHAATHSDPKISG